MIDARWIVAIDCDGHYAGTGRWDDGGIVDCPAVLGAGQAESDETYEALSESLCEALDVPGREAESLHVSVERPDGRYTATLLPVD